MPKTTALNRIPWTRVARVTATGTRTTTSATYVDIPTDTVALASLVKKTLRHESGYYCRG